MIVVKFYSQFAVMLLLCVCSTGFAASEAGKIDLLKGGVTILDANGKPRELAPGVAVYEGDTVVTAADGEAHVLLTDNGFIAVKSSSRVKIETYRAEGDQDDKAIFDLLYGTFRSLTGWIGKFNVQNYSVKTPTATIGVRGTDHEPLVQLEHPVEGSKRTGEAGTYDKVNEGETFIKNQYGEINVKKDQLAFVARKAKAAPRFIRAKQAKNLFLRSRFDRKVTKRRRALQPNTDVLLKKRQQRVLRQLREGTLKPGKRPIQLLNQPQLNKRLKQEFQQRQLREKSVRSLKQHDKKQLRQRPASPQQRGKQHYRKQLKQSNQEHGSSRNMNQRQRSGNRQHLNKRSNKANKAWHTKR